MEKSKNVWYWLEKTFGALFLSLWGACLFFYGIPFLMSIFDWTVAQWQSDLMDWFDKPFLVLCGILIVLGFILLVNIFLTGKDDNQATAELVIELQKKQAAMEAELKQMQAATCRFPWYTSAATAEQRIAFEQELNRLASACEKGARGTIQPLISWLLDQEKSGVIKLPNNYSDIFEELTAHYHFGLSKQAFLAAMPTK